MTEKLSSIYSSGCFILTSSLRFGRKITRVIANTNCILIEPLDGTNGRAILPVSQVISMWPCFCTNVPKKLTCDCIKWPEEAIENGKDVTHVRIFYAIPIGKVHWKVAVINLSVVEESDLPTPIVEGQEVGPFEASSSSSSVSSSSSTSSSSGDVVEFIRNVTNILDGLNRPRKLLIFINPFGGKRKAPSIYERKVAEILKVAKITNSVIYTERANHAKDVIESMERPEATFDGIICVGGDGMFSELFNGLIRRTQTTKAVDVNDPEVTLIRPSIPVGVIPAGSTDAVAFGVTGTNDPLTSTIHIILGNVVNIDISAVHDSGHSDQLLRYATSVLGYGFLADVLVDSEKNRWMGPKRYDWAGFKKLLTLRSYSGEIKLRVSTEAGSPTDHSVCTMDCVVCHKSLLRDKFGSSNDSASGHVIVADEKPSELTIRGRFLSVNCATMSCRCEKSKRGLSPAAHLGNGCSDLIIVSECSRLDYIRFLIRTGYGLSSSPFDLPFVDVYRVKEFTYRPISRKESGLSNNNDGDHVERHHHPPHDHHSDHFQVEEEEGVWNCDGEIIPSSAIRVRTHCQLLPVFGLGQPLRTSTSMVSMRRTDEEDSQFQAGKIVPSNSFPLLTMSYGLDESQEVEEDSKETNL